MAASLVTIQRLPCGMRALWLSLSSALWIGKATERDKVGGQDGDVDSTREGEEQCMGLERSHVASRHKLAKNMLG